MWRSIQRKSKLSRCARNNTIFLYFVEQMISVITWQMADEAQAPEVVNTFYVGNFQWKKLHHVSHSYYMQLLHLICVCDLH